MKDHIGKLNLVYLPASSLVKLQGNPRTEKDKNSVNKLAELIRKHGFRNPLDVWQEKSGKYTILVGNHRYDAGLLLKMKKFPCVIYAGTRKEAMARAISDNKSSDWTEWDFPLLKDLLIDLDDGAFDMELTGWDAGEIEKLFDYSPMGKRFNANYGGQSDDTEKPSAEAGTDEQRYPLTLVLSDSEWKKWEATKERMKIKQDKAAFLKIIGGDDHA